MTVQDYYRAFANERHDILRSSVPATFREPGDYDAADMEAFEAVIGPLLEARASSRKQSQQAASQGQKHEPGDSV